MTLTYPTPEENWSIAVFGDNLENEAVYANPVVGPVAIGEQREIMSTINPPRTYGVRLLARF